jgi:hypothetical protein
MNRWDLAGWVALLAAVCLQLGLLVGAETVPVFPPVGAHTPGLFSASVPVGPVYTMLWRLATFGALGGLAMMVWARKDELKGELDQMKK